LILKKLISFSECFLKVFVEDINELLGIGDLSLITEHSHLDDSIDGEEGDCGGQTRLGHSKVHDLLDLLALVLEGGDWPWDV